MAIGAAHRPPEEPPSRGQLHGHLLRSRQQAPGSNDDGCYVEAFSRTPRCAHQMVSKRWPSAKVRKTRVIEHLIVVSNQYQRRRPASHRHLIFSRRVIKMYIILLRRRHCRGDHRGAGTRLSRSEEDMTAHARPFNGRHARLPYGRRYL